METIFHQANVHDMTLKNTWNSSRIENLANHNKEMDLPRTILVINHGGRYDLKRRSQNQVT